MSQIQGLWKTKNQNMADLCKEAKELKDKFLTFEIYHVFRVHANGFLFLHYSVLLDCIVLDHLHQFKCSSGSSGHIRH